MPEFYAISAENAKILHDNCSKKISRILGHVTPPYSLPPPPAPMGLLLTSCMLHVLSHSCNSGFTADGFFPGHLTRSSLQQQQQSPKTADKLMER